MSNTFVRPCVLLTMSALGENAPTAKPWVHAAERPTASGHGHYDADAIRPRGTPIV